MHAFWLKEKNYPLIALGICSIVLGIIYMLLFSNESLLKPDSLGYINFAPSRSIGYPFFLKTIYLFYGSYKIVPFIQISIFCFSGYFLSVVFFQMSQSFFKSLGLLVALLGNIPFAKLSFFLLTDSLSLSLLMLSLAMTIRTLLSEKPEPYYILCGIIGLSALIRPLFIILSILPIGIYLFRAPSLKKAFNKKFYLGMFIILLFLLTGSTIQFFRHGFFRTEAFLGNNLIGKTLLATTPDHETRETIKTISIIPPIQEVLSKAPNLQIKYLLSESYYDELRSLIAQETSGGNPAQRDDLWKKMAISSIKRDPKGYLSDIWMNYWALWQLWDLCTFKEKARFDQYIQNNSPLPLLNTYREPEMRSSLNQKFGHPIIVYSVRALLGLCFIFSIIFPILAIARKFMGNPVPPFLLLGTLCALTIQAGFVGIACVQAGLGRYGLSFWPCFCLLLLTTLTFSGRILNDK